MRLPAHITAPVFLAGLLTALVVGGPSRGAGPATPGLTETDRKDFYHLPEGSEIFPIDWLRALTSSTTGKPFLDDLGRFGVLDDPAGPPVAAGDPRKLPVGLTRAKPRGSPAEMLGVNCAACHVAELRVGAAAVRVDGAPSLFDIQGFYEELFQSAAATLADRARLAAFLTALQENGPADGPTRLLVGRLAHAQQDPAAGAGTFEAVLLGRLRNALGADDPVGGGVDAGTAVLTAGSLFDRAVAHRPSGSNWVVILNCQG